VENSRNGNTTKYLLPNWFKTAGLILFLAGIVFSYLHFSAGVKPKFLDVKVFALYSTYLETKSLKVIHNNISEEICGFTTVLGLLLFALSKEKNEKEHYGTLRLKAFIISGYLWALIILASFFLIFGLAFINILSFNLVLPLLLYSLIFRYLLAADRRNEHS
jgi:hypothetical protein